MNFIKNIITVFLLLKYSPTIRFAQASVGTSLHSDIWSFLFKCLLVYASCYNVVNCQTLVCSSSKSSSYGLLGNTVITKYTS